MSPRGIFSQTHLLSPAAAAAIGFVTVCVESVPLHYCEGLGEWRHAAFRVLYSKIESKFEFAVQDTIKSPNLKPAQPETLSR